MRRQDSGTSTQGPVLIQTFGPELAVERLVDVAAVIVQVVVDYDASSMPGDCQGNSEKT